MKKSNIIFLVTIILMAAVVLYIFDTPGDGPDYAAATTGRYGVSLFFDTLRHMDYPVRVGNTPLTSASNTDHVYIIIQPFAPPVDHARAEEMLEWVRQGGRLIFLHRINPTIFDTMIPGAGYQMGAFRRYQVGYGEVITGRAFHVVNHHMMSVPRAARELQQTLAHWDADRIWFAEYYHGMYASETFLGSLPLVVQLLMVQMLLAGAVAVWRLGKRFGRPMPYYNEVEREENEHVYAFARLLARMK